MSVDANLNQINFQDPLRSKPVRENFTDVQNDLNDLQSQINTLATPPTGTEVTNARDYHTVLRDRLRSASKGQGNILISGGLVEEQSTPDMTVSITAGEALVDGVACKWSAQDSGTITAPVSDTRLDYVVVNSDNSISIVSGTLSATPVFPTVASTQLIVSALVVKSTTTSLNKGTQIFTFKNPHNSYFPNLYINASYTATDKLHNNVIVDLSGDLITGTLECQGNCWVVDYDNPGANGSGEISAAGASTWLIDNPTSWKISSYIKKDATRQTISGSGSTGFLTSSPTLYSGANGTNGGNLVINAFSIFINNIDVSSGDGNDGTSVSTDTIVGGAGGTIKCGAIGGYGDDSGNINLNAINNIEIITGGLVNLLGGDGGDGVDSTTGTVGNMGGAGGAGGDGGDFTYICKTFTNNGTLAQTAGNGGTGGTGSGGSDNNANGDDGDSGSGGSTTATLYDFTSGLPSTYANWIHPLYMTSNEIIT